VTRLDASVGQRLAIGSTVVAVLVAAVVVLSLVLSGRVQTLQDRQVDVIAPRSALAEELESSILYAAVAARNYVFTRSARDLDALSTASAAIDAATRRLMPMPHDGEEQRLVTDIVAGAGDYREAARGFVALLSTGQAQTALEASELALAERRERVLTALRAFGALQSQKVADNRRAIRQATAQVTTALATLGVWCCS
jgi:CHASE3 domain sensor protein